ncbi:MAG TPA: CopD family protein [Candidatus Dormibacteraeota bacterium]
MSRSPDLLLAAFHWLEYIGLLGGVGALAVRRLGRMPPRIGWAEPPMHIAFTAALAGGVGVLLFEFHFGWVMAARVIAEGVALILCVRGIPLVAPFAVLAAALLAPAGHAAGVQPEAAGAELADALHVLAAGMWAGGILALASLRPPGGWRSAEARTMLDRFGRVALIAFGITALTGLLRATEQLHQVSDLWATTYGMVLALKSAGVVGMLGASLGWRRGWPVAPAEAALGLAVIALTALLAAFPLQA